MVLPKDRAGLCYKHAADFVQDHPEWILHHGRLDGHLVRRHHADDVEYSHAWAVDKHNNFVYEPLADKLLPLDWYEKNAKPTTERTYKSGDISAMLLLHQHWGPWHTE